MFRKIRQECHLTYHKLSQVIISCHKLRNITYENQWEVKWLSGRVFWNIFKKKIFNLFDYCNSLVKKEQGWKAKNKKFKENKKTKIKTTWDKRAQNKLKT